MRRYMDPRVLVALAVDREVHGMRAALVVFMAVVVLGLTLPFQGCGDNDNSVELPCCPACGDGVCSGDEVRCNCPFECSDDRVCFAFVPTCGDGICQQFASPGESHERCPEDCPLACRRGGPFDVDASHPRLRGAGCPSGTTEAYRDNKLLVCNNCDRPSDCHSREQCQTVCGPGCENDTGSCCARRDCVPSH